MRRQNESYLSEAHNPRSEKPILFPLIDIILQLTGSLALCQCHCATVSASLQVQLSSRQAMMEVPHLSSVDLCITPKTSVTNASPMILENANFT